MVRIQLTVSIPIEISEEEQQYCYYTLEDDKTKGMIKSLNCLDTLWKHCSDVTVC